jgi:hypothetical protein
METALAQRSCTPCRGGVRPLIVKRRWVVERIIAGLNRNRRLAKDFEA